jgi:cytochrome c5
LAALYRQSCATCHAAADTGAPLTLDRDAWAPRWAKGEDALVRSTVEGLNAMPPGGQCFACTSEDYRALTAFMAGRE